MATYEYRCNDCGIWVSITHTITGSVSLSCTQCKAEMVLQIPAASVVFKGEGWAKKDRRGKV